MVNWQQAQDWELLWWAGCSNTYGEETKQLVYAEKMGLRMFAMAARAENFDLGGASVLDIGGGPVSLLLKCTNRGQCYVLDPLLLKWPAWVLSRYHNCGIVPLIMRAEDLHAQPMVDEAWLYNVLEHVISPACVVRNARRLAKVVRVFEWVNTRPSAGHPHSFTADQLDGWLGGAGQVEQFARGGAVGLGYFGVFKGRGE